VWFLLKNGVLLLKWWWRNWLIFLKLSFETIIRGTNTRPQISIISLSLLNGVMLKKKRYILSPFADIRRLFCWKVCAFNSRMFQILQWTNMQLLILRIWVIQMLIPQGTKLNLRHFKWTTRHIRRCYWVKLVDGT